MKVPDRDLCPTCSAPLAAVGAMRVAGESAPEAGDATFCVACGEMLEFDQDLRLVSLQPKFSGLAKEVQNFLLEIQREIRKLP